MEQPRIFRYDTVDSTNTVCKSLAAQGAPSGTAVIARRQTAIVLPAVTSDIF